MRAIASHNLNRLLDEPGGSRKADFIIRKYLFALINGVSAARQGRVFQRVGIPFQKAGQPLDRELWVGGGNPKDYAQGNQDNRP